MSSLYHLAWLGTPPTLALPGADTRHVVTFHPGNRGQVSEEAETVYSVLATLAALSLDN